MRVLLVNDDGPPSSTSPHVLGLWETLQSELGWNVSVVLPSSQKSWGSMAFSISAPISVWYYYPIKGNYDGKMEGTSSSWSSKPRTLQENEVDEWILLDGSPTTCANVGLNNLSTLLPSKKPEPFDLVISGPNYGRNTGTAFALGSGTIGAALAASLSGTKAVSLSYGHFQVPTEEMKAAEAQYKGQRVSEKKITSSTVTAPTSMTTPPSSPVEVVTMAHKLSCRIIAKLFKDWEEDVSIYTINVPLSYLLKDEVVYWTQTWPSKYGQLFKVNDFDSENNSSKTRLPASAPIPIKELRFSPSMAGMLQPKVMAEGTDIWALMKGYVSVARLEARYAEAPSSKTKQGQFKL